MFGSIYFGQGYFASGPLAMLGTPLPPIHLGIPTFATDDPASAQARAALATASARSLPAVAATRSSMSTGQAKSGNFRLV